MIVSKLAERSTPGGGGGGDKCRSESSVSATAAGFIENKISKLGIKR